MKKNKIVANKMFGAFGNTRLIQYQVEEIVDEQDKKYYRWFIYYKGNVLKGNPTMSFEEAETEALLTLHELMTSKAAI